MSRGTGIKDLNKTQLINCFNVLSSIFQCKPTLQKFYHDIGFQKVTMISMVQNHRQRLIEKLKFKTMPGELSWGFMAGMSPNEYKSFYCSLVLNR